MMFLRVCYVNTYGQSHCEGVLKSYKNFPLDKNMTLEQLETFIKEKVNFRDDTYSIEFMEEK